MTPIMSGKKRAGSAAGRLLLVMAMSACSACAHAAMPQPAIFPAPPDDGVFHVDEARVLRTAEAAEIDRIAAALLQELDIPILVVVLRDLASRGAAGYTIERYASELFDHWGIGSQERNYGMLLLVSVGDRVARIELGAAWQRNYDHQAQHVMNSLIVPEFRDGRHSEGVLAGARGMDAMARGLSLPSPRQPWWVLPSVVAVFAAVTGLVFSLLNSGRQGWAFALLAVLGMLLLLFMSLVGRQGSSGGSESGGGRFGGGSSGGGGATGRW
jgi:uncharacterized protein